MSFLHNRPMAVFLILATIVIVATLLSSCYRTHSDCSDCYIVVHRVMQ